MYTARRRFLSLAAAGIAAPFSLSIAWAQPYPARPVRLIVGFPPGGTADLVARLIGQWLSERLGQPFVIENRPGAGTNIATEAAVRAPADGYTLLLATANNAVNATLYGKLSFNFLSDIAPVASIMSAPLVLEVIPSLPVNTIPDLITYAKANPAKLNLASFGTGTISHLSGELFKMMAGTDMVHVPYRGSAPMLTDLLGGRVHVAFDAIPASLEHIRAGSLRALWVTSARRMQTLPDTPTIWEFLAGYEVGALAGIVAPKNTPGDIVMKLNEEINSALADAKFQARLVGLGATPLPGAPSDYGHLLVAETEKWGKVIKSAGLKPE